jgi:hypothetical protein
MASDVDAVLHSLLAAYSDGPVAILNQERVTSDSARSPLYRLTIDADGAHRTVIARLSPEGFNPSHPAQWPALGFFRQLAALQLLDSEREQLNVPQLLADDVARGAILLQDLGSQVPLADLLERPGDAEVDPALISLAEQTGRLHAATAGRRKAYLDLLHPLGAEAIDRVDIVAPLRAVWPHLVALAQDWGFHPHPECERELQQICNALAQAGPFLALAHGDVGAENALVNRGTTTLIDFEFAGYRHALLDGVAWWMGFPTSRCSGKLPTSVLQRMDDAYRCELIRGCAAASDDRAYESARAAAAAYWLCEGLAQLLPAAKGAEEQRGRATNRQILLGRIEAFLDLTAPAGHAPALRDMAQRWHDLLQAKWRTSLPPYPSPG